MVKSADVANKFTDEDIDRIIQMAWEDRTPFEAIEFQFGLKEKEVIAEIKSDGAEVIMSTPKEFSDRIRDDMIKWSAIIKSAGISQQ